MQTDNRLFDDITKFVNGAAGTFAGMTREAEASFEAVKAMAAAARDDTDVLKTRIAALEMKSTGSA